MDSPIYIRVGQRKEVLLSPLKTLGENTDKVPSKMKTEAAKWCDLFCYWSWHCLEGSQTCDDTAIVSIASGFLLMGFQIHRDNSDELKP